MAQQSKNTKLLLFPELRDINKVEALLKAAPKGTYKGIVPVDFAGRAVNLEAFRKLADEYGLWIWWHANY